jgi:HD superfamily phosphodiesterase
MHQELMNQDVARLQRAEILRNSGKRHVVEASNDEQHSVFHGIRVRVGVVASRLHLHRPAPRLQS